MTLNDYVRNPHMVVLDTLSRICAKHDKLYCYPSMHTLSELIHKFTGRSLSTRSLCRHLGALERDGWIGRQRRHKTGPTGELELHSTMYILTARSVKFCRALGTKLWVFSRSAAKSLIDHALPFLAETLARESKSTTHRAAQAPPRWKAAR
jgi:hypothetical protein